MPEQNEKNLPKAPAFNPKVKETIAAFKENNNPKNLNDILNELVRSPLLAPAVFDLQSRKRRRGKHRTEAAAPEAQQQVQPAPKPEADGRVQLPKETKISLVMVTSPEGKRYYLGFSDWDAVHEWQKAQPKAAQQIILLRFDDYANMIAKNAEASGLVINPGDNSLRLERPLIESVKKTKDEVSQKIAAQLAEQQARRIHPGDKVTLVEPSMLPDAMIDPVCAVLADAPGVGSAYLSVMIVNGDARSYLLVLDGPKDEKLFASVAQAARPYLLSREKKMDLNITTSISPLGQQGMQGSEPFYRKGIGRVIEEDDDE